MKKDSVLVTRNQIDITQTQKNSGESISSWLRLIRDRRWSRRQKHELLKTFLSPNNIYQASSVERSKAITGRIRSEFINSSMDEQSGVQKDLSWLEEPKAHCISFNDPLYPQLLRQIDDPPLALFVCGDVSLLNEPQVAIVGSRRPTPIGGKVARQLAQELSDLGLVITSGMALGIDGLSHEGALDQANSTIAVMGCGLDTVYPARNRRLFEKIKQQGLLISEYPTGVKASKYTFPERNRIVSGLSLGVVIIEAAIKSGTMITARLAVEQNRELMVLPGSVVSAQYEGSHSLLRDGAALITNSDDVLFTLKDRLVCCDVGRQEGDINEYRAENNEAILQHNLIKSDDSVDVVNAKVDDNVVQIGLLKFIGAEPVSTEELIINSGLTAAQVSSMLLMLELEGRVAVSDDGGYINLG